MKTRSPLLPEKSLVFDIGANIGQVSRQFLDAGAAQVVAVEACQEIFQRLYKVPGIVPIHAAAWDTLTIVPVHYEPQGDGVWSSCVPSKWQKAVPAARFSPPQYVPTVTLDELINVCGKPHLIKIDVEGVEAKVLAGLSQMANYLMFEFNRTFPEDALACLDRAAKLGYTKASFIADNLDLQTVPAASIAETTKRWMTEKPFWGMFTLA